MKLNAAAEMLPVTWDKVANIHPFVPFSQVRGYHELFRQLEVGWQRSPALPRFCNLMPAPKESMRAYWSSAHTTNRVGDCRNICLIPTSAHGTNPASAAMYGMRVVPVACDSSGNIDHTDLESKIGEHGEILAALMITYPSTHGVFEESIEAVCAKHTPPEHWSTWTAQT